MDVHLNTDLDYIAWKETHSHYNSDKVFLIPSSGETCLR